MSNLLGEVSAEISAEISVNLAEISVSAETNFSRFGRSLLDEIAIREYGNHMNVKNILFHALRPKLKSIKVQLFHPNRKAGELPNITPKNIDKLTLMSDDLTHLEIRGLNVWLGGRDENWGEFLPKFKNLKSLKIFTGYGGKDEDRDHTSFLTEDVIISLAKNCKKLETLWFPRAYEIYNYTKYSIDTLLKERSGTLKNLKFCCRMKNTTNLFENVNCSRSDFIKFLTKLGLSTKLELITV